MLEKQDSENEELLFGEDVSARPHDEQLAYWKRDLRLKRWSLGVTFIAPILICIGLAATYYQARRLDQSLRATVQTSTLNHVLVIDRMFLEHTDLRPYFYDGKVPDPSDARTYPEVLTAAETILDVFDVVCEQRTRFGDIWSRAEAWDKWIIDTFRTSPILRTMMEERASWYDSRLLTLKRCADDPKKNEFNCE